MSKVTVWFIKSAMVYLILAVLMGIHMSMEGPKYPLLQIHTHLNLLGWMSMMIFGVAYHILPRFSGTQLWSEKLSVWHLVLANIGLLGMTAGWVLISLEYSKYTLLTFSIIEALSIFCFVLNMFKTIKPVPVNLSRG